jgi:hypothetical protein
MALADVIVHPQATFASQFRASSSATIFVQPGAQVAPVLNLIRSARHSIRMEVYLLTNRTVIHALQVAEEAHIDVRVMLEQHPFGSSRYATLGYTLLQQANVPVRWANESAYRYTHEKAIVVDGQIAGIFTFNLTSSGIFSNRELGVIDTNAADARVLSSIFDADWRRRSLRFSSSRLVVSPYNSRSDLTSLIDHAHHTLDVYAEEVADGLMEGNLILASRHGVRVRIITSTDSPGIDTIRRSGVAVRIMPHPYVHAKAIVADGQTFFVGSENLSTISLDDNREAGIVLSDGRLAAVIEETFTGDWRSSGGSGTIPVPVPTSHPGSHALTVKVTTSPHAVSRGQRLTIAAATSPGASCTVRVTYADGYVSRSKALQETKTAGSDGIVSWSWRVGTTVAGTSQVSVSCTLKGASATGSATFTVT